MLQKGKAGRYLWGACKDLERSFSFASNSTKPSLLPVTVLGILAFLLGLFTRGSRCRQSLDNKLKVEVEARLANTKARLAADGLLADCYSGVNITVDMLDATITGTVATEADRNAAARLVGDTEAVRLLIRTNRVKLKSLPPAPMVRPVPAALSIK